MSKSFTIYVLKILTYMEKLYDNCQKIIFLLVLSLLVM